MKPYAQRYKIVLAKTTRAGQEWIRRHNLKRVSRIVTPRNANCIRGFQRLDVVFAGERVDLTVEQWALLEYCSSR